jgi:uncharacterized DUF497 family protein
MPSFFLIWDLDVDQEGNVQHIAEHGITQEEVEEVLNDTRTSFGVSKSSGLPMAFGMTVTGRYLTVVFERVEADPPTVRPVTAYEVPAPFGRRKRKGKRRG